MASKKPGPYAPLSAYYADDERIMEAGEDAELLYLRMLAYAARTPRTDGWISEAVIVSRLGILPRIESGNGTGNGCGKSTGNGTGSDAGSRAERLAEVGLIVRERSGYRIAGWLKWNDSAEQIERRRAQDRNRKNAVTSDDSGNGTGSGSGNGTGNGGAETSDSTDQKQKQKQKQKEGGRKRPSSPLPDDWQPTDSHRRKASEERIDLAREIDKFKSNALAKDLRYANWDQAFHTWLSKEWVTKLPGSSAPGFWKDSMQ